MENREDLKSILPFLPLCLRSSSLFWPPQVVEALKALAAGPNISNVNSGELLFIAITDIRNSINLEPLPYPTGDGYSLFFDDLLSRAEAGRWFGEVLPELAKLLLRLPVLLEGHYGNAEEGGGSGLRLLESQEPGMVMLSQELIGALLTCSLLCLFPITIRGAKHLPTINFDQLFASLYEGYNEKQESKIKCMIHYFERICSHMPEGVVSFERKVLPFEQSSSYLFYPKASLWGKSRISLCPFLVHHSGLIEDQSGEALEVDFANKYLGGGALNRGCVQEEIRFMINPELIAGMLFLPSMKKNEAIEIVGAERFSNYTGYASSFRFSGDHVDQRDIDTLGRRKTRIIAIDAKCNPGKRQYEAEYLLREINKAFCGFIDQCKHQLYLKLFHADEDFGGQAVEEVENHSSMAVNNHLDNGRQYVGHQDKIGIVTGNWGSGAFGGDPELKAIIQWLAASQALRPFISYHTFGIKELRTFDHVTRWITSQKWNVGDLWDMLVQYSSQKSKGETNVGFCSWLLPSLSANDPMDWS